MKSEFISIIIPSGRPDRVFHTVKGILNQTIDRSKYEVIVVTPDSENMREIEAVGVQILCVERLFAPGKMRNIGANVASGETFYFIDDDCLPPSDWLAGLMATLKSNDKIGSVGCRVVGLDSSFWSRCADYSLFASYQYHKRIDCDLGSAAIVVRREAFEAVNGFDEDLLASEDWDLSLKLKEKNWLCVFDPSVEVQHDHRCNTLDRIIVKAYLFGYYSGLIVQKRHVAYLSWLAELSVKMAHPLIYWLLIIPYAFAVALVQSMSFVRYDLKIFFYLPFIIMARISYHIGVLRNLIDCSRNKKNQDGL